MDLLFIIAAIALVLYIALHYGGRGNATMQTAADVCFLIWAILLTLVVGGVRLEV